MWPRDKFKLSDFFDDIKTKIRSILPSAGNFFPSFQVEQISVGCTVFRN